MDELQTRWTERNVPLAEQLSPVGTEMVLHASECAKQLESEQQCEEEKLRTVKTFMDEVPHFPLCVCRPSP